MNYAQLCHQYPPRPIHSEQEFQMLQARIDEIVDAIAILDREPTEDERDYLDILGTLALNYESSQEQMPSVSGIQLLRYLVAEHGLKQKDLVPIFHTESIASDVLRGKRGLTVRHIQELSKFFSVSPAAFFE